MISLNKLNHHNPSALRIYGHIEALAKRDDLYSEDDFYFGFDSSDFTFLDIIGARQPLAIKHGPTLTLYKVTIDSSMSTVYYRDVSRKTFIPLIHIHAQPSEMHHFNQTQPWVFINFNFESSMLKEKVTPYKIIAHTIEWLALGQKLKTLQLKALQEAVMQLTTAKNTLSIKLENLDFLENTFTKDETDTNDFVTLFDSSSVSCNSPSLGEVRHGLGNGAN